MSGDGKSPVVDLLGSPMSALLHAIPAVTALTGREVILIGGLAVVCRLTLPYRATSDLDTVNRRAAVEPAQLELLLASGAEPSGPAGVLVPTGVGPVQVDVLEVTDAELSDLPAQPGALVAMKLQSMMNRGSAKEATDLLDIVHLTFDLVAGPVVREQLSSAEAQLREDAALHVERFFAGNVERSHRLIRARPEATGVGLDDLRLAGELLSAALLTPPATEPAE